MKPDFKISLGRIDRTPALRPILSSISVIDKPGIDADSCDIVLFASRSLAIPESGTDVTVWLGYEESGVSEVFKGVINKIVYSGPPTVLSIQATGVPLSDEKRLQGSHTRSWNDTTLGAVFEEIIQTAGFVARVHDALAGICLKRLIQSIETDIEILAQLAKTFGGVLKSDGDVVAVVPRDSLERADGEKLPMVTIGLYSKYSWTLRQRDGYKTIVAFYQDAEAGETKAVIVGSGEPELRLKTIFDSESAARNAAEKELEKLKARTLLNVSLPGRFIPVGSPLRIVGAPKVISDRDYQVVRVHHSYGGGYTMSVEAEGE